MEFKLETLPTIAERFISYMDDNKVFALVGEMGVGKTTFIKEVCKALRVNDTVNSPTFSIINEYYSEFLKNRIYHFDFFRIESTKEIISIGIDDYFESGALCFIEWADKIKNILPPKTMFVKIKNQSNELKKINWYIKQ
jgi:tRNA threonylcarbamoyladenosine biosynthesis protein TsaE